ncbi:MAG: AMP-binding protein [Gammaproteobacteria bacterium]|nr:AMP-binding protein [Gammaproteobacteria bacterium]MBU1723084.1 AMP-binding protein [Gammaproteobacteria bacterium]MBU2004154.1 AMP-binding protein [Gammaproteobacteria bacterium]
MPQLKRIYGFMIFVAALLLTPLLHTGLAHLFAGQNSIFLNAWAVLLAIAPFALVAVIRYSRSDGDKQAWQAARQHSDLWLTIMGQGVFWAIMLVLLAIYPAFAKSALGLENSAAIVLLMAFAAIGIFIGILIAERLSQTHVETGVAPIGAFGIVAGLLLFGLVPSIPLQAALFLGIGIMGGLFVAPMHALLRYHVPDEQQLAKTLPLSDMVQTLVMLVFVSVTAVLAWAGLDTPHLLTVLTTATIAGALYTFYHLPQSLLRFVVSRLFHARYRLKVIGFEHLPARGGVLLLGNHISFIDWALVQMASPRQLHFVIEKGYYERWYLKGILNWFGVVPISGTASADSLEKVTELLKAGEVVCLFPEGAISRTGQLGEFKRGYEKAIKGTDAVIVPFYLHGLWGSRFSRSSGFLRQNRQSGFKRDIVVAFGKSLPPTIQAYELKQKVFDLSFASWDAYSHMIDPIPLNWLRSAKRQSFRIAASDVIGEPMSHHRFMTAVFRFAAEIDKLSPEQNIGMLLPTSAGGAIANMAVLSLGKTVVNLNFTASAEAIKSSVEQAGLKQVYTSKRFLDKLKERNIDITAILPNTPLVFLEDLKEGIPKAKLLGTLLMVMLLPTRVLQWLYLPKIDLESTAAILFSSGSEGAPKGIELSHRNLAINARQVADALNTLDNDVIMGTLPTFHAFGLLASTLMPLAEGIPIICHPDPTDAVNIAKGIARYEATLLFGTSTFLRLYAKNSRVHPLMFQSLRYVVAGAEKLSPDVRRLFLDKFGKKILEGYGATETSPVASVNLPDQLDTRYWRVQPANREGTVGLPLPGTSFRIVDPGTLEILPTGSDGLILIGGPQVMKGYLHNPEKTAEAIAELDGQRWYKTGDKGHVDEDGFLTIVDRYSRFAKLGGEMVSLGAIEQQVRNILGEPELELVAINLPDEKKGEKVILMIAGERDEAEVRRKLLEGGMNALMIPAVIRNVEEVPKLGSGKTDFANARKLALSVV